MTRDELRDRLAPVYRQLRAIVDDTPIDRLSIEIRWSPTIDSVIYSLDGVSHLHYANDLFRDWKPTTEQTR